MPSTAVYVKNLSADLSTEEIEDLFLPFCDEGDGVLIVPYLDRGIAFVDLGSTEAVVRAVAAAKQERLRSRSPSNHGLVTVEPSKKPVRASGLRAMNVRLRGGNSEMDPRGVNGTVGGVPPYTPSPTNSQGAAVAGLAAFPGRGRNDANYGTPNGGGLSGLTGRRGPPPMTAGSGAGFSSDALPMPPPSSLSLQGSTPCWVVLETRLCETCPVGGDGGSSGDGAITSQERRVVAVFLDQAQAVAAACALWEHIKASLAPPPVTSTTAGGGGYGGLQPGSPSFTYQELREDKANGSFVRRVANGDVPGSYEVRQVAVEAPSCLNPTGQVLHECCGSHLVAAQDPNHHHHHQAAANNNNTGNGSNGGSPAAAAAAPPSPPLPSPPPRQTNNALEATAGPWLPGVL